MLRTEESERLYGVWGAGWIDGYGFLEIPAVHGSKELPLRCLE